MKSIFSVFVALPLLLVPAFVSAGAIEGVVEDLAPASGYVLMSVEGEALTDLNAETGIKIGDLLSIVKPGDAVVHPVTEEQLAPLNQVQAVLRVTKVKADYSYAVPFFGAEHVVPGAHVKRFAGLRTLFVDRRGTGESVYTELSALLPNLDWLGYYPAYAGQAEEGRPEADLIFTLTAELLTAKDSKGRTLHTYAIAAAEESHKASHKANPAPSQSIPAVSSLPTHDDASSATNTAKPKWEDAVSPGTPQVLYESANSGYQLLGSFSANSHMADFVRDRSRLLLASTDGQTVQVHRADAGLPHVVDYQPLAVEKIHALRWWQPANTSSLYLAVSATVENPDQYGTTTKTRLKGTILELRDDQLIPVAENLEYFLGTFDLDGEGGRELLLGQELDLDNFFGRIRQLHLADSEVMSTAPPLKLSRQFPVQGSALSDLSGNGRLESAFLRNGSLTIQQNGKTVYQERSEVGGSLSRLIYDKNPGQMDALFTSVAFEVSPTAVDLDADGTLELVTTASDQPTFISLGGKPNIQKSWLSVFKYSNGRYLRGVLGGKLDAAILGHFVEKDQVLLITFDPDTAGTEQPVTQVWSMALQTEQ